MQTAAAYQAPLKPRAKPFLKWAGGKTQLLAELLARMPTTYGRYYEPFLGGGAVFFALQPKRATLSDINDELITTYTAVRDTPKEVITTLSQHTCSPEYFYQLRKEKLANLGATHRAARLIYLNRTCFNGLYRVNAQGDFNVPFGGHNNPTICHAENLQRVSEALRGAQLRCQPVAAIARQVRRGDLVYFDPPYVPLSPTARFTNYAVGGFGLRDQVALARLYTALAARGVHVVLSNSDTPQVRELYKKFRIDRVMVRRSINRCAQGRGPVGEVIVTPH
jgi:DNA adenine methylase